MEVKAENSEQQNIKWISKASKVSKNNLHYERERQSGILNRKFRAEHKMD
jgi:hypothetical protein